MPKLLSNLAFLAFASTAFADQPPAIDGHWVLSAEATEAAVSKGRIDDPRRFSDFLGMGSTFLVVFTYEFKGRQGRMTVPISRDGRSFHLVSTNADTSVWEVDGSKDRFVVRRIDAETISIATENSPEMGHVRWQRGRRDDIKDAAQLEAIALAWFAAVERMQARLK